MIWLITTGWDHLQQQQSIMVFSITLKFKVIHLILWRFSFNVLSVQTFCHNLTVNHPSGQINQNVRANTPEPLSLYSCVHYYVWKWQWKCAAEQQRRNRCGRSSRGTGRKRIYVYSVWRFLFPVLDGSFSAARTAVCVCVSGRRWVLDDNTHFVHCTERALVSHTHTWQLLNICHTITDVEVAWTPVNLNLFWSINNCTNNQAMPFWATEHGRGLAPYVDRNDSF